MGENQSFENDILNERQKQWGEPVQTHDMIARIWTALLLPKLKEGVSIDPHEVALCMDGLKSVRVVINPGLKDSYTDKHGYTELVEHIYNNSEKEK